MDEYEKHEKIKKRLGALYERMDADKAIYQLDPYILRTLAGKRVEKAHNVTLNAPAVFANRAVSILSSSHQQVVVRGKGMTDMETSYIEDFINAVLYEIDQDLFQRGFQPLFSWNCFHSCLRGRLASRNLCLWDGEKFTVQVTPWDTRHTTYDFDDGLSFLGYDMNREPEDIESEYKVKENSKTIITDIYTKTKNIITIGTKEHRTRSHGYDELPGIYVKVPSGSMFVEEDSEERQGESVYSSVREIAEQLNKAATVLMTQNMQSSFPGLFYRSEAGPGGAPPEGNPAADGSITVIGTGEEIGIIPTSDMRAAAQHLVAMLQGEWQRGTLSNIDYGNLTFPLSGVTVKLLQASKDQIFVPRLEVISRYYQQLGSQIIRQYIKKDITAELGEEEHRRKFEPDKLKGNYTIKFRYFQQSPEQEMANITVGLQAKALDIPDKYIYEHIMKFENPTEVLMQRDAEKAAKLDPTLMLYDMVVGLINESKKGNDIFDTKAKMLKPTLMNALRAKMQPMAQPLPPQEEKRQQPSELLPMFSGGGGRAPVGKDQLEPSQQAIVEQRENTQSAQTNRERRATEGGLG